MAVDIGPRIGIDGEAEFRAQIKQMSQQIKTFGSEMAAVTSQFADNEKGVESLTAQNKVLNKQIAVQEQRIEELKKGLEESAKAFGENDTRTLKWAQAVNDATTSLNRMRSQVKSNEDAMNGLGDEMEDAGDSAASFWDIMGGSLAADAISGTISTITGKIQELGAAMMDYSRESENAAVKAAAYFGETGQAAEQTEKIIKDVYLGGVGDSMDAVSDAVIAVKNNLDDLSETDLKNITNQAITLESAYGIDMNETLRGVNSLMEQFGLTAQEAMDYIVAGTQNGLDKTNELGDNLSEYAGKFSQAGYSAEEYFQLLNNGLDGGAYNLDKVNDAINEVTTRLADGTIGDAIKMYSSETQSLFSAWENGEATQKQVIDSIVSDIKAAENQQDALNMAAEAFGTMAEDGSLKFIESLTSVGDTYTEVTGKAQEMFDATTTSQQTMDSALRTAQEQLAPVGEQLNSLAVEVIPQVTAGLVELTSGIDWEAAGQRVQSVTGAVLDFGAFVIDNKDTIIAGIAAIGAGFVAWNVATTIASVVAAIKTMVTAIQGASTAQAVLNAVMGANPIVKLVSLILTVVTALVTFIATNEDAQQAIVAAWNAIVSTVGGAIAGIGQGISSFISGAKDIGSGIIDGISSGIEYVSGLPGEFLEYAKESVTNFVTTIKETDWIQTGKDILTGLANGILGTVGAVVDAAKNAAGKIKNAFTEFFDIHSPSRVMKDEVGRQITAGIAEGILANEDYAEKSAEEVASAIVSAAEKQLSNYQVYHDMTLAEEAAFWNEMRQKVAEGTQARIDADKKYFDAKKKLDNQILNVEKKYSDSVSQVYQDLSKNISDAWDNYHDQVDSLADSIRSQLNLFEEFDFTTEQTTDSLLKNLESQVEGMTVWRNSLKKLASRGLPQELLEELEGMGVSAAGELQVLSEMTDDELDKYISLWSQKNSLANQAAREQSEPLFEETQEQIREMRREAKAELQAYQEEFVASMESIGVALIGPLEQIKNALVQNYVDTIGTAANAVSQQANDEANKEKYAQVAQNIIAASDGLPESFYSIGVDTVNGIINGLNSQSSALYQTMEQIINGVVLAAQQTMQIHSPSRVMENFIGKNIIAGLAEGLTKYQGMAIKAAQGVYAGVSGAMDVPRTANGTAAAYNRLADSLGNMQIVLNDGTLVGKLTPRIDAALGGYTKLKGRYYT